MSISQTIAIGLTLKRILMLPNILGFASNVNVKYPECKFYGCIIPTVACHYKHKNIPNVKKWIQRWILIHWGRHKVADIAYIILEMHFRDWHRKATSHYMIHHDPLHWRNQLNTLRPRQNGRYFADDFFKWVFLNENAWISLKISLKFVPKVRINNIPSLV